MHRLLGMPLQRVEPAATGEYLAAVVGLHVAKTSGMRTSSIFLVAFTFVGACATHAAQPAIIPLDAADDDLAVEMNMPASVGVLDNDTGVDDGRVLTLVSSPAHGMATLADDGTLSYTPATGYLGD